MPLPLTTNSVFDEYAAEYGWSYDNGGSYLGQHWDWYAGQTPGLVLMRQPPARVAVVRYDGLSPSELWSGQVATDMDFDRVMALLGCARRSERA
jgi:hypothetical protein